MAPAHASTCSAISSDSGEPMEGTAPERVELTFFLPHDGPWPHDPLDAEGIGGNGGAIDTLLRRYGARLQLIRRPGELLEEALVSRTRRDRCDVHAFPAPSLDDLSAIEAMLKEPERGRKLTQPLHFVCTHGRRDICCARHGMPVYQRLAELAGDRVYQTSHLGGHRFAPLLLTLPRGISYGRVQEDEAEALEEASQRGAIFSLERLRGVYPYTGEEQIALRRALAAGADFKDFKLSREDELITVESRGITRRYNIRREPGELRVLSCGAEPSIAPRFIVSELENASS